MQTKMAIWTLKLTRTGTVAGMVTIVYLTNTSSVIVQQCNAKVLANVKVKTWT
jgi:hypothetical protein